MTTCQKCHGYIAKNNEIVGTSLPHCECNSCNCVEIIKDMLKGINREKNTDYELALLRAIEKISP